MGVLINLLVGSLAVWQLTEILQHARLTLGLRQWAAKHTSVGGLVGLFSYGLLCAFCKATWLGWGVASVLLVAEFWPPSQYLLWPFAMARLANLANDFTYNYNRLQKADLEETDDDTTADDAGA